MVYQVNQWLHRLTHVLCMVSSKDFNQSQIQPCQLPSDNLTAKCNSKRAIGHTAKQEPGKAGTVENPPPVAC